MSADSPSSPTFVLVHGAWGGAWGWRDLGAEFDRRRLHWVAVDLPSSREDADPATSLEHDVAAVAAVAPSEGAVVLVAHSYGGVVATEVAPSIANLERVIYIAALVPALGQSATDVSREVRVRTLLDEAIVVDGDVLRLDPAKARAALYEDCTTEVADWAIAQLSSQTIASFRSKRTSASSRVDSSYIMCANDHAIDPSLQELMGERCNDVTTMNSGHCPFLSTPNHLCDLLTA